MLEPKKNDDGIIMEFKVQDTEDEKELSDTVKAALQQISIRQCKAIIPAVILFRTVHMQNL